MNERVGRSNYVYNSRTPDPLMSLCCYNLTDIKTRFQAGKGPLTLSRGEIGYTRVKHVKGQV